jgi:UDP-2,4-diacetamido-2,4,6-trideoxy-beta-L-altropyranose hydrolase
VAPDPDAPPHWCWLGVDWRADAQQTIAALGNARPDWLIVDHYALDARWERELRNSCRRLMVIDDLADRSHDCDLLLDQNIGRQVGDYEDLAPSFCRTLIGPRYALLRPEFAEMREFSLQRRVAPEVKTILITMGGVDRANATGQVLQALNDCGLPPDIAITVVMGAGAPWIHKVRALAANSPWRTTVLTDVRDMARVMADSDLAIGAAGATSWERCCLGVPTILLAIADNQRQVAVQLDEIGAAVYSGDTASGPKNAAQITLSLLPSTVKLTLLAQASAMLCDGKGALSTAAMIWSKSN